jgi:glc operon protein GlcG
MKKYIYLILFTALTATTVNAQVHTTYSLTQEAYKKIIEAAKQHAKKNDSPRGSIAIVDAGGYLLYLERMDNSFPLSAELAFQKARTAVLFKNESKLFEGFVNSGSPSLTTIGIVMLQGGVPIIYKGEVIGAIGVSGAKSPDIDSEIAKVGASTPLD